MFSHKYDKIIVGGGLYGLYAALYCGRKGEKILVLEYENRSFMRATYINQARVHKGYHYPRSYSTAKKSADYFARFNEDFGFCINGKFQKIYATSANFSYTNSNEFQKFCKNAQIPCTQFPSQLLFNEGMTDGAFLTEEYTYDAAILLEHLNRQISQFHNINIVYDARMESVSKSEGEWVIEVKDFAICHAPFVLNASYASVNQVLKLFDTSYEPFKVKYELCEIILCDVNQKLKEYGITVMDGPFFSLMPFGKTGYHSLTAVSHTPHETSYEAYPVFGCQKHNDRGCTPQQLGNCNLCSARPDSAWPYMSGLARKYLREEYQFEYVRSLFSMKPILAASEVDDSRPTVIKIFSTEPVLVSVLSGKINTVYDLDNILDGNYKENVT